MTDEEIAERILVGVERWSSGSRRVGAYPPPRHGYPVGHITSIACPRTTIGGVVFVEQLLFSQNISVERCPVRGLRPQAGFRGTGGRSLWSGAEENGLTRAVLRP